MTQFAEYFNIFLPYYVMSLSVFAFIVTVTDKLLSKAKARRVPEKWFVIFSALGGGLGVLSAFYLVRHKTKHIGLLCATWIPSILCYVALCATSIFFQIFF